MVVSVENSQIDGSGWLTDRRNFSSGYPDSFLQQPQAES